MAACSLIDKDMFSGEVIFVGRVYSFMSVGRRSVFFHYINVSVLLEVPDGGLNKLMRTLCPNLTYCCTGRSSDNFLR